MYDAPLYPSAVILADDSLSFVGTYLVRIIIKYPHSPPTYLSPFGKPGNINKEVEVESSIIYKEVER